MGPESDATPPTHPSASGDSAGDDDLPPLAQLLITYPPRDHIETISEILTVSLEVQTACTTESLTDEQMHALHEEVADATMKLEQQALKLRELRYRLSLAQSEFSARERHHAIPLQLTIDHLTTQLAFLGPLLKTVLNTYTRPNASPPPSVVTHLYLNSRQQTRSTLNRADSILSDIQSEFLPENG